MESTDSAIVCIIDSRIYIHMFNIIMHCTTIYHHQSGLPVVVVTRKSSVVCRIANTSFLGAPFHRRNSCILYCWLVNPLRPSCPSSNNFCPEVRFGVVVIPVDMEPGGGRIRLPSQLDHSCHFPLKPLEGKVPYVHWFSVDFQSSDMCIFPIEMVGNDQYPQVMTRYRRTIHQLRPLPPF